MEPKFTLNREKPSDEEINKHKDFDELVRKFKQQSIEKARGDSSFLKNKKVTYSAVIAGVAVLCTVTYFTVFKKQPPTQKANDKIATTQTTTSASKNSSTAPAKPPVSKMAVPYTAYKVDAKKGATITHASKSKIHIPKTAFVNKQGADIVGEVEIKYREFHNPAEIIASGIPMTYDSAGTRFHFESAGMFDIRGYQNGEPVYIKPNKIITVEMASQQPADRFNQYALDTVKHNWTYLQRDTPKAMDHSGPDNPPAAVPGHETLAASPKAEQLQKQIDRIPPRVDSVKRVYTKKADALPQVVKPLKPAKATKNRPQFELDVNYKEFPELAAFKNALFEIGPENTNYTDDLTDITWSSAVISEGTQKGKNYLLTLKLRQRVEKLVVYPVLSGANYDEAMKGFEKRMTDYNTAFAKRQADEKRYQEEMLALQKAYLEESLRLKEELKKEEIRMRQLEEKQLADQFKTMGDQQRVFRTFRVSNFGVFNSDCGNLMPKEAVAKATYGSTDNATLLSPVAVYLVEHGRNLLFTVSGENMYNLGYNPSKNYSLCVFANGAIYTCSADRFKAVTQSSKQHFTLEKIPDTVEDPSELRKALGI